MDDFFRCLHSFLYGSCYDLRILYFDLRCQHLRVLVCHSNSTQNESCEWLQLPDSTQLAQNPFNLDINPKHLVCKYPKPYFRVIPLFSWIMNIYKLRRELYIYINLIECIYTCLSSICAYVIIMSLHANSNRFNSISPKWNKIQY